MEHNAFLVLIFVFALLCDILSLLLINTTIASIPFAQAMLSPIPVAPIGIAIIALIVAIISVVVVDAIVLTPKYIFAGFFVNWSVCSFPFVGIFKRAVNSDASERLHLCPYVQ